jgi:hypothetical protein
LLNGEFLIDYYSAYSSAWVDRQPIQSLLESGEALLWIGSYFDLLETAPLMIADLDLGALKMARNSHDLRPALAASGANGASVDGAVCV